MIDIDIVTDEDFGLEIFPFDNPKIRKGARGIIFNEQKEIAILYKEQKQEFKLIGGEIEKNETPQEAFEREALEESGCRVKIEKCLGTIKEFKSHDNFIQTSYIFVAHVIENTNQLRFTEQEKKEGSKLLWLDLDTAIEKISQSENNLIASPFENELSVYHSKFIVKRDYKILQYYKKQEK